MSNEIEKKEETQKFITKLKKLKNWFELDVTIKLLGVTVLHWHFPPDEEEDN